MGAVSDGGVVGGNNQNGSTRLWEQRRRSQPSSGWILLGTSAGAHRSPGLAGSSSAPGRGEVGSLGTGSGCSEQQFNPGLTPASAQARGAGRSG